MRAVDVALVAARDAAERLDYKSAADSLIAAGRKIDQIPAPPLSAQVPAPAASLARSLRRKRAKIDVALALAAGRCLWVLADPSEVGAGGKFTRPVGTPHRAGLAGGFP